MAVFHTFPWGDDYEFSDLETGLALAGLFRKGTDGLPVEGVIGGPPVVTAVVAAWKVQVGIFHYLTHNSGSVRISGLSSAEQLDIVSSASIPSGQARIDRIVWDPSDDDPPVVITGVPAASPVAPSDGGLERLATVRVNAGDGAVVGAQIVVDAAVTGLSGANQSDSGVVSARNVPVADTVRVPVLFEPGRFSSPPNVQVTLTSTGVAGRDTAAWYDPSTLTKDGVTVVLGSNSPVARTVGASWRAEAS